jgi:hypothetical protein
LVPVHQHLIDLGLLRFVENCDDGPLFAKGCYKRVLDFVRTVMTDKRVQPNHGGTASKLSAATLDWTTESLTPFKITRREHPGRIMETYRLWPWPAWLLLFPALRSARLVRVWTYTRDVSACATDAGVRGQAGISPFDPSRTFGQSFTFMFKQLPSALLDARIGRYDALPARGGT